MSIKTKTNPTNFIISKYKYELKYEEMYFCLFLVGSKYNTMRKIEIRKREIKKREIKEIEKERDRRDMRDGKDKRDGRDKLYSHFFFLLSFYI